MKHWLHRVRHAIVFGMGGGLIMAILLVPIPLPAQGGIVIKPTLPKTDTVGGFTYVNYAWDGSIYTGAAATASAHCSLLCLTPKVFTTTWSGLPSGYVPASLIVRWGASAGYYGLWSGTTGSVEAKVEYSLDGGSSFQVLEVWTSNSPPSATLQDHDKVLPLNSVQDPSLVQVRATLTVRMTDCGSSGCAQLNSSHVAGSQQIRDIRIEASDCHVPTGETTYSMGWNPVEPTAQDFRQVLAGPAANGSFNGRRVTEEDPGGGGPDTCYYSGSSIPPATKITGGTWSVGSANQWGDDTVGWDTGGVNYYRQQGRAPCQTGFPQRMVIDCGSSKRAYVTNLLQMGIESATVWSERAGVRVSRSWP